MKRKIKIHPNECPKCGNLFKKISGIWRCTTCQVNKKYDIDDGRPREGFGYTRIKPLIED